MNYIWFFMIVFSYCFSFFNGNTNTVTSAMFDGCENAVALVVSLLGMMCFWTGLLEIAQESRLTLKIQRILFPIIHMLFPKIKKNSDAATAISMSMTANLLGLSNAATPLGISAMKILEKNNSTKDIASNEMCLFVVINTASITLIPTTLLTLRNAFGSSSPFEILIPVWCASLTSVFFGVISTKICAKRGKL